MPSSPTRRNTDSSNLSASHRCARGASSFSTNEPIDSRRRSCSSVKMKCFFLGLEVGLEDGLG